jgi:RNA polymerase sigma-70 factor (ECF subfamily)
MNSMPCSEERPDTRTIFTQFISRHQGALHGRALKITGSRDDAQDLVQDTLLKAFSAYQKSRHIVLSMAWLYRILINTYINQYRRATRIKALREGRHEKSALYLGEDPSEQVVRLTPEQKIQKKREREKILIGLSRVSRKSRSVLLLADVMGYSYVETAGLLHCPVGTVMSRLHRARGKLRAALISQEQNGE